jgi:hypothetical protein
MPGLASATFIERCRLSDEFRISALALPWDLSFSGEVQESMPGEIMWQIPLRSVGPEYGSFTEATCQPGRGPAPLE